MKRRYFTEEKLLINLPADLKEEVRAKAEREGTSMAAIVRRLLFGWIKDDPSDNDKKN